MKTTLKQWQEYFNIDDVRSILDDFSLITDITLVIKDLKNQNISELNKSYNKFCNYYTQKYPEGKSICEKCGLQWSEEVAEEHKYKIFTCQNGLVNIVAPIYFENDTIGYLLGGPVRINPNGVENISDLNTNESINDDKKNKFFDKAVENGDLISLPREWHERNAKRIGVDPAEYIEATNSLAILSIDRIEALARILYRFANNISKAIEKKDDLPQKIETLNNNVDTNDGLRTIANNILIKMKDIVDFKKASIQVFREESRILIAGFGFEMDKIDRWLLRSISSDNLILRIVKNKEPYIISNTEKDTDWKSTPGTSDIHSWIGIPILFNDTVIGLITLDHDQAGFYKTELKDKLISFASEVAPFIRNAYVIYDTQNMLRDINAIKKVIKIVNSKLNKKELLQAIATQIAIRLNCSHCTIFLQEKIDNTFYLVPKVTHGGDGETLNRKFKINEGIAGFVFNEGNSIIIPNAKEDPHFAKARISKEQPRSMLVAPIKIGDQITGVICADQDAYGWFIERDKNLVDILALQAGIAIQRSLAVNLIHEIGERILLKKSVKDILERIISEAIELINASTGNIYLLNTEGRQVIGQYGAPYNVPGFKFPVPRLDKEDGITRTIFKIKDIISIPNVKEDEKVRPEIRKLFASMIAVPLKVETQVIGVFYLYDKDHHDFNETEKTLLEILADQAAIAIEKAKLFDTLNKEIEDHQQLEIQLENLHKIFEVQDLEGVLNRIGNGIMAILGPEISPTINLYDQEIDSFGACHCYGPLADELTDPPRNKEGTGRYVLRTQKPLFLKDVDQPLLNCPTIRKRSIALGVKSFAAIPLKSQDQIVGVLFINAQKIVDFDNMEIQRVLQIFANQAAVAIQNSRLYQQAQMNAAVMKAADIGLLASGISHEFNNILQNLCSLFNELEDTKSIKERKNISADFETQVARTTKVFESLSGIGNRRDLIEDFDLDDMIKDILSLTASRLKDHCISVNYDNTNVRQLKSNASGLQTVIINLLYNAIEAVAGNKENKIINLLVSMGSNNKKINIYVEDNGPGITPEELNNIFLPFYTTKGAKSMGIGLFWVHRIIVSLKGEINVKLKNDIGGATFHVILPIIQ
jgi:GAF domain-containing protein/ligand-binding sensor protein